MTVRSTGSASCLGDERAYLRSCEVCLGSGRTTPVFKFASARNQKTAVPLTPCEPNVASHTAKSKENSHARWSQYRSGQADQGADQQIKAPGRDQIAQGRPRRS